jgi:hypothetical protein
MAADPPRETADAHPRRRPSRRLVALTATVLAALVVTLVLLTSMRATPVAGAAAGPPVWFAPNSFWNQQIPAGAPLAPDSAALVGELNRQVRAYTPWVNIDKYSVPVYTVPRNQPRVRVGSTRKFDAGLRSVWASVPIPAKARTSAGDDRHMVVWQPSTDTMWEFWNMRRTKSGGWQAEWGGRMRNVSRKPGYFLTSPGWGATATGLPLVGGLITVRDLKAGRIDHPLAIAVVEAEPNVWSLPAQRTDGFKWTRGISAIPEGTRFRLDPTLDIASLKLPRITRMMAEAAQKYGLIVRDKAGSVVFYMEDPITMARNPYPQLLGKETQASIARAFPWGHLEALPLTLRTWPGG